MNLTDIFVHRLVKDSKVVTIDTLFNEETVKKTQYAPPYQRNYVWDGEKATYFLESILIGTEIPPLIFFRSKKGVEIIDGRQRYETILRFLKGELRLSKAGLKKLDISIAKKTFISLPDQLRNDFLDTKLRVIEFSFASYDGLTQLDVDSVKQEIFKRYNSGITPLKSLEVDKAYYFDDGLNIFFKEKLKDQDLHKQFDRLFKYEDKKIDVLLQKIRQLLVIHKIPIKYYSTTKRKITDKYYDLLSSQLRPDEFEDLFDSFKKKLDILDEIRGIVDNVNGSYNRLMSEVLFWAFSILEDNDGELPETHSADLQNFADHILRNIRIFEMVRSSFAQQIIDRYALFANYLEEVYHINKNLYIETNDQFKKKNRALYQTKENGSTNYQELRINKPEPTTYTIDDICRLMKRHRFLVRPPYQREEVINNKKSSEIIESLLLGIKLPPIFIFKNEDGVSEVIDGQQRILSILAFLSREYENEEGQMEKSKKDGFKLSLKDSILTHLHNKRFSDLEEDMRDKINNFDLWVIEINKKNNPDFDPLDLFIRLNNKPYPIKDDTFEMWNSYLDRGLIETIKTSYQNNANWFFMRKLNIRMENENNYTVLSYFNYLEENKQDAIDKGPLDIYKIGERIAIRLRSKGEISKILENPEKKAAFVKAVNNLEFIFLGNLKELLRDENDNSEKTLSKNLDELLGVENYKRTQQSFYALWYFLNGLDHSSFINNKSEIRRQVRDLFNSMSSDIRMEDFNNKVETFRAQYKNKEGRKIVKICLGDILKVISFAEDSVKETPEVDFYVRRDNTTNERIQIVYECPKNLEAYYGCRINRLGFSLGYIAAMLQSSYVYNEYDFCSRNVSMAGLKDIWIPYVPLPTQNVFGKMLNYTKTHDYIQREFFINVLDCMVDEITFQELFKYQNVSLIEKVMSLEDVPDENPEEFISNMYNSIINERSYLMEELIALKSVKGSIESK